MSSIFFRKRKNGTEIQIKLLCHEPCSFQIVQLEAQYFEPSSFELVFIEAQ